MSVDTLTYEKTSYEKIEYGLRTKLNDNFKNVYVSPVFEMVGNECVRIDLESVEFEEQHQNFSVEVYSIGLFYYTTDKKEMKHELVNKNIKARIDRLKSLLLLNKYNSTGVTGSNNKWINLKIESILLNQECEDDNVYCTKFNLNLTNTNQY